MIRRPLGLALMTALPPTEGHLSLIRFAAAYMSSVGGELMVLMCVLPEEPPHRAEHFAALDRAVKNEQMPSTTVLLQFSNDPQGPSGPDDDQFWSHWAGTIVRQSGLGAPQYVFSSEAYGGRLAASLGAEHVPFDTGRDMISISATKVRADLARNFRHMVEPMRAHLRRRICVFGQESVGKTTVARGAAARTDSVLSTEWARPYLEGLDSPTVTDAKMTTIFRAQQAQELAADLMAADRGCPFVWLDTDLLSTMGYQNFWAPSVLQTLQMRGEFERVFRPADLYVVLSDEGFPFVPDPLRYGVDRRETTMAYWVGLLEAHRLPYTIVTATDPDERLRATIDHATALLEERAGFARYERRRT